MKKLTQLLLSSLILASATINAEVIIDNFDSINTEMWKSEYRYPEVSDGFARFTLEPGIYIIRTSSSGCSRSIKKIIE